jgi:hypothetical protein
MVWFDNLLKVSRKTYGLIRASNSSGNRVWIGAATECTANFYSHNHPRNPVKFVPDLDRVSDDEDRIAGCIFFGIYADNKGTCLQSYYLRRYSARAAG